MEYVDKPKPSRGYVAFIVFTVLVVGFSSFSFLCIKDPVYATLFALFFFPLTLIAIELLHASYATEYRITGNKLELRCGWLMRRRISLSDIQSVENAQFISRVIGWSPGVLGYCNRFTNGLLLKMPTYAAFISPSNPEAFREALQTSREAPLSELPPPPNAVWHKRCVAAFFGLGGLLMVALSIPLITGAVPPNHFYGVRTSATLGNSEVWYAANYVGGIYFAAAGAVIFLGCALLFAYAKRLSTTSIVLTGTGLTLFCTLMIVFLTLWQIG